MFVMSNKNNLYKNLPDTPGVYLMKGLNNRLLYVGKAGNLKRRVSSYFLKSQDSKTEKLVSEIRKIDYIETGTAIEALILEAELIKKHTPPFNIREKDDKSFLFVEITKEKFPRVLLVRGKNKANGYRFGPFTSANSIREALRIVRRIFPFSVHDPERLGKFIRPCFDYEIGTCPGTCIGVVTRLNYLKNIRNIKLFFEGKKEIITKSLEKEMKVASKKLEFEEAEKIKRQIFALHHIQDIAFINESEVVGEKTIGRIEGYDISNISGTNAVGSMVVFVNGKPDKDEYRKFKINTVKQINDVGMMNEVLKRRFGNSWTLPDLVLVDGGLGQVNVARKVLREFNLKIPIIGIAKGPTRKANRIVGKIPEGAMKKNLIQVRDEAHRFAISYHKKLRRDNFIKR